MAGLFKLPKITDKVPVMECFRNQCPMEITAISHSIFQTVPYGCPVQNHQCDPKTYEPLDDAKLIYGPEMKLYMDDMEFERMKYDHYVPKKTGIVANIPREFKFTTV